MKGLQTKKGRSPFFYSFKEFALQAGETFVMFSQNTQLTNHELEQ